MDTFLEDLHVQIQDQCRRSREKGFTYANEYTSLKRLKISILTYRKLFADHVEDQAKLMYPYCRILHQVLPSMLLVISQYV